MVGPATTFQDLALFVVPPSPGREEKTNILGRDRYTSKAVPLQRARVCGDDMGGRGCALVEDQEGDGGSVWLLTVIGIPDQPGGTGSKKVGS